MCRAISLVTLTVLVLSAPAFAATLSGKVVKVTDGDTITILDNTNTSNNVIGKEKGPRGAGLGWL